MHVLIILTILLVIIMPGRIGGHARPEYALVMILCAGAIHRRGGNAFSAASTELTLLVALTLSMLLSIVADAAVSVRFTFRDLFSAVRYLAMVAMILGTSATYFTPRARLQLLKFLCLLALFCTFLSIAQYFNLGGMNSFFLGLYGADTAAYYQNFVIGGLSTRRIIGTTGNPNLWAYLLTMVAMFAVSRTVVGKHFIWAPVSLGAFLAVLMTGSRSSTVAFFAGALAILGTSAASSRNRGAMVASGALIAVLLPTIFFVYTSSIDTVGPSRFSADNIASFYARVELWIDTFAEYSDSIVLGRGPGKAEMSRHTLAADKVSFRDNTFISVFTMQGVIGLTIFVWLTIFMWVRLRRMREIALKDPPAHQLLAGMTGVFVAYQVFNMAADALLAVQQATTFMVLYGATIGVCNSVEQEKSQPEGAARAPAGPWVQQT